MFSPKSATPQPDLANFSIPRIRGSTPRRQSVSPSVLVRASPLRAMNSIGTKPTPKKSADIVLPSPSVNAKPKQWQVELQPVPLSFEEEEPVEVSVIPPIAKNKRQKTVPEKGTRMHKI